MPWHLPDIGKRSIVCAERQFPRHWSQCASILRALIAPNHRVRRTLVTWSKRMNLLDVLLLVVVAVVVVGALLSNGDGLSLLFKGGADQYKDFEARSLHRWVAAGSALVMIVGYVGYRVAVSSAREDYAKFRTTYDTQKALEDEVTRQRQKEAEKAERDAERAAFEARFAKLEGEKKIVRDEPNFRLVQAVTKLEANPDDPTSIPHTIVRQLLDDAYGEKELAIVYHLFEGTTAWRYNAASIADPDDFFVRLQTSSTAATLGTYDFLIGIGLGSNSPAQAPDIPQRRARFLCGLLSSILPEKSDVAVYGLSIGNFIDPPLETSKAPQPVQRPVLLAGVERVSPNLDEQALILEMMMSFDYSGIKLGRYSSLAGVDQPHWYEVTECNRSQLRFGRN